MSSSTKTFSGFTDNKSSSRVLQPPGGGSSNIFGVDTPTIPNTNGNGNHQKTNIFGVEEAVPVKEEVTVEEEFKEEQVNDDDVEQKVEVKAGAGEVINKPVYNPITGEEIKPVRSSTRVRQPPGGASTKLW